jgi:hypothetical protein
MPSVWSMAVGASTSRREVDTDVEGRLVRPRGGSGGFAARDRRRRNVLQRQDRCGRRWRQALRQDGGRTPLEFVQPPQHVVLQGVDVCQARGGCSGTIQTHGGSTCGMEVRSGSGGRVAKGNHRRGRWCRFSLTLPGGKGRRRCSLDLGNVPVGKTGQKAGRRASLYGNRREKPLQGGWTRHPWGV